MFSEKSCRKNLEKYLSHDFTTTEQNDVNLDRNNNQTEEDSDDEDDLLFSTFPPFNNWDYYWVGGRWMQKLKKRYGIRQLSIPREKLSSDFSVLKPFKLKSSKTVKNQFSSNL